MPAAAGNWKLLFNVVDVEIGRNFFVGQYLALRPHAGLKGTWQKQNLIIDNEIIALSIPRMLQLKQKIRYWGIGMSAGTDTSWQFTSNFSLFANCALTALWTDFHVHRKEFNLNLNTLEETKVLDTTNNFYTLKPILECTIGLRGDVWWNDDDCHFGIEAGWEEQVWWSFNQFIKLTEEGAHGDLTLHGLTVKARFDF
jgi:hypothetical protein